MYRGAALDVSPMQGGARVWPSETSSTQPTTDGERYQSTHEAHDVLGLHAPHCSDPSERLLLDVFTFLGHTCLRVETKPIRTAAKYRTVQGIDWDSPHA